MDFEILKKCVELLEKSEICKYQIEQAEKQGVPKDKVDEFCFNKLKEIYSYLEKQLSLK
jgi:anaerobic selenocysteine-containing dehydrogenase